MKKETIDQLYKAFEQYALEVNGIECWSARELQELLGYSKWENFSNVIDKAKEACRNVGQSVVDHFPDVRKTIAMPKGAEKEIDDYLLTRYACYLVFCMSVASTISLLPLSDLKVTKLCSD